MNFFHFIPFHTSRLDEEAVVFLIFALPWLQVLPLVARPGLAASSLVLFATDEPKEAGFVNICFVGLICYSFAVLKLSWIFLLMHKRNLRQLKLPNLMPKPNLLPKSQLQPKVRLNAQG